MKRLATERVVSGENPQLASQCDMVSDRSYAVRDKLVSSMVHSTRSWWYCWDPTNYLPWNWPSSLCRRL